MCPCVYGPLHSKWCQPIYYSPTTNTFMAIDVYLAHPSLRNSLTWKVINNAYGIGHFPILFIMYTHIFPLLMSAFLVGNLLGQIGYCLSRHLLMSMNPLTMLE